MGEDRWWDRITKAAVSQFAAYALGGLATIVFSFQFGWAALAVGAAVTVIADGFIGHGWVLRLIDAARKARVANAERRAEELRVATGAGRVRARSRQIERARHLHNAAMEARRALPTAEFENAMAALEITIANPGHDRGIVTVINHGDVELYHVRPELAFFWRPEADWIIGWDATELGPEERAQFESRFEYEQFETTPAVTARDEHGRVWTRHQDGSIEMHDPEITEFEAHRAFGPRWYRY